MVTEIGQQDTDANGRPLSGRKRARIHRLRKLEKRIKTTSGEQRLQHGLDEVRRLTNRVGAGKSFRAAACSRYKEAVDEELLDGRSIEGVAGAVVYVTLREWDMPRTMASVAAKVGVDETQFQRTLRYVMSELGILSVAPTARDFLPQFTSKLSLSGEGVDLTYELITVAEEANLGAGKDPAGMVGGAAYLASHLKSGDVTQEDASNVANVTNVTIRNRAYDLLEAIGFDREGLTVRDISEKAVLQRLEGETASGDCAGSDGAVAPATAD
jgi:transcription initiation factor TFIIB